LLNLGRGVYFLTASLNLKGTFATVLSASELNHPDCSQFFGIPAGTTLQDQLVGESMSQYDNIMQLMGIIAARQVIANPNPIDHISDAEFRVFSQFGEEGIIQYLIKKCKIGPYERRFVEFGVENYLESNTRFLLMNNNWSGVVMDPSRDNISSIKSDDISWRHDLQAICCFVGPEYLDTILSESGFDKDIGLLSIDIDGMDYWIWQSLTVVRPIIVICEYNSVFGQKVKITVPYKENFDRRRAHYSTLYGGASLNALVQLALSKGYYFVGSNLAGNNAFFVRNDRIGDLPALTSEQGYVESKFRESRDEVGNLTYVRASSRVRLIEHMPVYDLETKSIRPICEIGI
jgi:hypothetical protein